MRFPNKKEFAIGLTLAGLAAFFIGRGCQKRHDQNNLSTVLAPDVRQKITVDPRHHSLVIISRDGSSVLTLPDRPSSIEIMNTGKVKVNSPQFGLEASPFLGAAFSLRGGLLGAGLDILYWKRLDLGLGAVVNPVYVQDTSVFLSISYRVWSNTSLAIGLDNHTTPLLLVKVRL